jgi:hypothetical protein
VGHVVLATLVTVVLSFLYNGWSLRLLWQEFWSHLAGTVEPELRLQLVPAWSLRWFGAMAIFAVANFPWPLLLLAVPGLILAHTRTALAGRWLWLSFLWGTYVVLTLMANKMERYLQPVYPLLCLFTVWWVFTMVRGRWRTVVLLWVATAYAAVLWLAHEHPTPWFPDHKSATTERYMHEIGMPGRAALDGLRRYTYHPRCELRPVIDAAETLGRRSSRPLALAVQWSDEAVPELPHLTTHDLVLPVAQRIRHRFVYHHDAPNRTPLDPIIRGAPSLIVLHPRTRDFRRRYQDLEELDHRDVVVRCGGEVVPARVTLYRPAPGR